MAPLRSARNHEAWLIPVHLALSDTSRGRPPLGPSPSLLSATDRRRCAARSSLSGASSSAAAAAAAARARRLGRGEEGRGGEGRAALGPRRHARLTVWHAARRHGRARLGTPAARPAAARGTCLSGHAGLVAQCRSHRRYTRRAARSAHCVPWPATGDNAAKINTQD